MKTPKMHGPVPTVDPALHPELAAALTEYVLRSAQMVRNQQQTIATLRTEVKELRALIIAFNIQPPPPQEHTDGTPALPPDTS